MVLSRAKRFECMFWLNIGIYSSDHTIIIKKKMVFIKYTDTKLLINNYNYVCI